VALGPHQPRAERSARPTGHHEWEDAVEARGVSVKLHQMRSQQEEFKRRSRDRAQRMQGLVSLFQSGEISVKKFRDLAGQLKAAHRSDQRSTGVNDTPPCLI
jgi:hypothetical protein